MDDKVTVLEVVNDDFEAGGAARQMWNWYENINLNKIQIDFFIIANWEADREADEKYRKKYLDKINQNGRYYYSYFKDVKTNKKKTERLTARLHQLSDITRTNSYDCVHLHGGGSFDIFFFYLAVRKNVKKVIMHSHTAFTKETLTRHILYLVRPLCRGKKLIYLACSDNAARWSFPADIVSKGKYTVLKNGINISRFKYDFQIRENLRSQMGLDNKFVVGHVGRFVCAKNHTFLIDIFNQIHLKNSDAVLLLVGGTGELEKTVKEKAESLGLTEYIIFYGITERVNELYQAMDCFVLPSNFEGLGIVAIEAQAAGLKTLCSEAVPKEAQVTDLLEHMSLEEPAEKWADKILSYNNGYERKDTSKEIKNTGYDIKSSAKQLEKIYMGCSNKAET